MTIAGWSFEGSSVRLFVLPAITIAGCAIWMVSPERSDAESQFAPASSRVLTAQNVSLVDRAAAPEQTGSIKPEAAAPAEATTPAAASSPETTVAEKPVIHGVRISSQSWRRGGLGSKALVTLTLRNTNDYAVKDIEIACAFTRRDGSHLTDRRRVIADTINRKSRKTWSRLLVGFVNVNANKAKCLAVAASRS